MTHVVVLGEVALHVGFDETLLGPDGDSFRRGPVDLGAGGSAGIVAVQLSRIGSVAPTLTAMIGGDPTGVLLSSLIASENIIANLVRTGRRSTCVVILRNGDSHRLLVNSGDTEADSLIDALPANLNGALLCVSAFPEYDRMISLLYGRGLKVVGDLGYRPWLDALDGYEREITSRASLLYSAVFSATHLPLTAASALCEACRAAGASIAVATRGASGALIFSDEGAFDVSAASCDPRDTLGAGDSFLAGFLHGLTENFPIHEAGRWGCAVAGAKIENPGGFAASHDVHRLLNTVNVRAIPQ